MVDGLRLDCICCQVSNLHSININCVLLSGVAGTVGLILKQGSCTQERYVNLIQFVCVCVCVCARTHTCIAYSAYVRTVHCRYSTMTTSFDTQTCVHTVRTTKPQKHTLARTCGAYLHSRNTCISLAIIDTQFTLLPRVSFQANGALQRGGGGRTQR